jgi:(E)-4-hydroxy-3-methylbut-2-enyl-diphosphate synthase
MRRKTRVVKIGNVLVGGNNPISVQSMTNTRTLDIVKTINQIKRLKTAGCELVRISIPDKQSADAIHSIKEKVNIPLIADIHFDYKLAIKSIKNGIDGLRINPGNIRDKKKIIEIVNNAKKKNIPIRIGVNSGSIDKKLLGSSKYPDWHILVKSDLKEIRLLENNKFYNIIISIKSSDVNNTIKAYQKLAGIVDYPFHIGVTEAGTGISGMVRSAVGIGTLLYQGIGDTIRVSLSDDPVYEVKVGFEILKSLGLRKHGLEIISCPTCARVEFDVIRLVKVIEKRFSNVKANFKIAVMGCVVNGPGEARFADLGIAGGKKYSLIFKKGKIIKKIPTAKAENIFISEITNLTNIRLE